MDHAAALIRKLGITKVAESVPGGSTGQESIYHGVKAAGKLYGGDNVVFIHGGARPLINAETIT